MTSFVRWFKEVWSRNEPDDSDPTPAASSSRSVSVRPTPTLEKAPSTIVTTSELPVHITSDRNLDQTIQGIITLTINEEVLSRNGQHTSVQNTPISRYATPYTSSHHYGRSTGGVVYTGRVNLVPVRQEDSGLGDMGPAQVQVKIEPEDKTWDASYGIHFNTTPISASSTSTSPPPTVPESRPIAGLARELEAPRTHVSTQARIPVNQQHVHETPIAVTSTTNRPITRQIPPAASRSTTPTTESNFNPSQYKFTPADFQFKENFLPPTPPVSSAFGAPSVIVKSEPPEMKRVSTPPVLPPVFQHPTPKSVSPPPLAAPITPSKPTTQHLFPFTPPPSTSPKPTSNHQSTSPPSPSSPTRQTTPRRPPILISPTHQWTSIRSLCAAPLTPQGKRLLPRVGPPCLAVGCTHNLEFDRVVSTSNANNSGRPQYLCPTHRWEFGTFADLETEEEDESKMCYCGERSRRTMANSGKPFWKCMEVKCRYKRWS